VLLIHEVLVVFIFFVFDCLLLVLILPCVYSEFITRKIIATKVVGKGWNYIRLGNKRVVRFCLVK